MENIPQFDKSERIQFRCPAKFKQELQKLAIDLGASVEDMCAVAVSEKYQLPLSAEPAPVGAA